MLISYNSKSFGMENVYEHFRNKIGMNGVVREKSLKCFVRFSRPVHNLKFGQFTLLGKLRNSMAVKVKVSHVPPQMSFIA